MARNCYHRSNIALHLLLLLQLSCDLALSLSSNSQVVEYLPGFNGPLPFYLETGYIGIDEGEEVQLFYYFFESENNPKEDPLMLWLAGGPGCSGMTSILFEIGPIQLLNDKYNGSLPTLVLNPYSWTKFASIIFADMPVGAGFSYSQTRRGSYTGDYKASHNANEFLRKWLNEHPQFLSNSIYLGGDSYSGHTVPLYFEEMLQGNEKGMRPFINLEGYLLGNPITDEAVDENYKVPFAHGMGLISNELYESLQEVCGGEYHDVDSSNIACMQKLETYDTLVSGLNTQMILEPNCQLASPRIRRLMSESMRYELMRLKEYSCRTEGYQSAIYWMNDWRVQEALNIHIRKGTVTEWIRCNGDIKYTHDVSSSVPYHAKLSAKGYRSLIYSGDHDAVVTFLGTEAWIKSLNYSIIDDWRQWRVDDQIAGYTRTYSNKMTFATVKGGGHTAPEYKPKECAAMLKRWILGKPL